MKRFTVVMTVVVLALTAPAVSRGAMDEHHHGDHNGKCAGHKGGAAHQEVVDGVKATFMVMAMDEAMKAMGMEKPAGMKDTHHIMAKFVSAANCEAFNELTVTCKVVGPDGKEHVKDLMGMHGHYGADFTMTAKGKYGVMCKFRDKDGKARQTKFWHEIK